MSTDPNPLILCIQTVTVEAKLVGRQTFRFGDPTQLDDLFSTSWGLDARAYLPEHHFKSTSFTGLRSLFTPLSVWVLPHAEGRYLWESEPRRLGQRAYIPLDTHEGRLSKSASRVAARTCHEEWDLGAGGGCYHLAYRGLYTPSLHRVEALFTLDLTGRDAAPRAPHYAWVDRQLRDQNALLESATRDVAQRLIDGHSALPRLTLGT